MTLLNTRLILERFMKELNLNNDEQLAEILGKSISNIRNWRSRNNIPFEVVLGLADKYDISLDWLITGKAKEEKLEPVAAMLLSGFNGLSDAQKLKVVTFVGNLASGAENSIVPQQTITNSTVSAIAGRDLVQKR